MCDKPLSSEYIPFAADHRRREGLGRRPFRPLGCQAQVVQFPSNAPFPELREASLAITLAGFLMACQAASQAPSFSYGVLDLVREGLFHVPGVFLPGPEGC